MDKRSFFNIAKIQIDPDDISTRFISDLNLSSPVYFNYVEKYSRYNCKDMIWSHKTLDFDENKDYLININIYNPLYSLFSKGSRIIKAENHDYLFVG